MLLVTAGPTREHLDDVRFLSNGASGRLGILLARAAQRRGWRVRLVLGPTGLVPPPGVSVTHVTSAAEMLRAARAAARGADLAIFSAAPADWRPRHRVAGKPPKGKGPARLDMLPTPDIAAELGRRKGRRLHVGFALETGMEALPRALGKLVRKRFDAIVLNTPSNLGRGGGLALWIQPQALGTRLPVADVAPLPTLPKARLATKILARAEALVEARAGR
ncbi:MAG: phosphopantothenoylcysteine decarboxylase [Planctomycetia bacterium]